MLDLFGLGFLLKISGGRIFFCWNIFLNSWNKTTDSTGVCTSIQRMAKNPPSKLKVKKKIKGLPYSSPLLFLMWQVFFSLQSSETVLQGHLWLWGKSLPPAGPCCWKLPFSSIIAPLAFCVLVEEVWLWAGHPLQAVLGMSCLIPPQPFWCCAAFSPPPAAQPPAARPFPSADKGPGSPYILSLQHLPGSIGHCQNGWCS